MEEEKKVIKGYKGFNKYLKGHGFQYEVGKEYHAKKAVSFEKGFHFCEYPLAVLEHYPPSDRLGINRFCKVEGSGDFDLSESDVVCCTDIKIEEEIGIEGLIEGSLGFIAEKAIGKEKKRNEPCCSDVISNTDDYSAADNTGDYTISANTGICSAATNTGRNSLAVNTGYHSVAKNEGKCSVATNMGSYSAAASTEEYSISVNAGNYSAASNIGACSTAVNIGLSSVAENKGKCSVSLSTGAFSAAVSKGDYSVSFSTGVESSAVVEGEKSLAIAIGHEGKAKGSLGSWLVLTECDEYNGDCYPIKDVKLVKVDGETIKPDTYYTLVEGKIVKTY